jgi:hypothetical protein
VIEEPAPKTQLVGIEVTGAARRLKVDRRHDAAVYSPGWGRPMASATTPPVTEETRCISASSLRPSSV